MPDQKALGLQFIMTARSDGAATRPELLDGLDIHPRHSEQRWIGYQTGAGPSALPEGPMRHLLLCDVAIESATTLVPGDLQQWSGVQINPQDRLAPPLCGGLMCLFMDIDPSVEEEYNAWYDLEHLAEVNAIAGVVIGRRFRAVNGSPRYLTLFHLLSREASQRCEFGKYSRSPWSRRVWPLVKNVQRYLFQPAPGTATPSAESNADCGAVTPRRS